VKEFNTSLHLWIFYSNPQVKNSARNGIFFQLAEGKVKYLQLISIAVETQQFASTTDDKLKRCYG
jgi:hypothetical protein